MKPQILAMHVGTLKDVPVPVVQYQRGFGKVHDVPIIMFAITGLGAPIIVDTGTADEKHTNAWHTYRLERPADQDPQAVLERAGIDSAEVELVIHTHLHYDHCGNDDLFPNARIIVQRSELQHACDPPAPNRGAYDRLPGLLPLWTAFLDRIETVEGDVDLTPEISLIHLPGHSPGSQGVLVKADDKRYLIAGDCVDSYANWRGDSRLAHIPTGALTDLEAFMASFERIEALDCEVIPAHDDEVIAQGVFG